MKHALYLMNPARFDDVYAEPERAGIAKRVHIVGGPLTGIASLAGNPRASAVEIILGGWGMPKLDADFFAALPNVRAVLYAAGAVNSFVTDEAWARGISISTANSANGVPVAEYTMAQIFLCLKRVHQHAALARTARNFQHTLSVAGGYCSTVGLVSLGAIGRSVIERLRGSDLNIIACDPFLTAADAAALGVRLCMLDELFATADVVSCHTPWLPETEGLLTGAHFARMKPNASFINTARGAVVREPELIAVLRARPDLFAVLDVTWPEPPAPDSPLYELPNVLLTPHIAGSMGAECRRMSQLMIGELDRYLAGQPLKYLASRAYARALA